MALAPDLAKKWLIRINTGSVAAPAWTPLGGMSQYTPRQDVVKQDGTTFDSGLYKGTQFVVQLGWGGSGTVLRVRDTAIEDPGQRAIRLNAIPQTPTETPTTLGVQVIDRFGGPDENVQGIAAITWEPQGGGPDAMLTVNFVMDGEGFPTPIANPLAATVFPVVVSASPSGAAVGTQVSIVGDAFTGTTSLKFGGVSATSFVIVSDALIVAVMPAGTAGAAPVTVTTPAGVSNALSYNRGA